MAIKNSVVVLLRLVGDGSSTSFSFDLLSDPYVFASESTEHSHVQNWFADNRPSFRSVAPSGVDPNTGGNPTFILSGTIVTATFSTAPAAGATVWIEAAILF